MVLSAEQVAQFERDGYLVIPGFTGPKELEAMRERAEELVEEFEPQEISIFNTKNQKETTDWYFLNSGGEVRFFFEAGAFDDAGALVKPKQRAINKIGHALHEREPVFAAWSRSPRFSGVLRALGFRRPLPAQSMYIFKQPGIGGEVVPHQDSTFLYTDPPSVVGLWMALEDAGLDNGCLWAVPGSHTRGVARRFLRAPDGGVRFDAEPTHTPPDEFVPLPVGAGDLVLLHGALIHRSDENRSARSRHAYSVHVLEGAPGVAYPATNWLQRPADMPFVPLYDDTVAPAAA